MDDDPELLEGLRTSLGRNYDITLALGPEDAFGAIQMFGPPTVVVTDMRMPGMDGAAFLEILRRAYPDVVRILLTGAADVADAARAVNQGRVFRFLTKPCANDVIRRTLEEAVALAGTECEERSGRRRQPRALAGSGPSAIVHTCAAAGHQLQDLAPELNALFADLREAVASRSPPGTKILRKLEGVSRSVANQARRLYDIARFSGESA